MLNSNLDDIFAYSGFRFEDYSGDPDSVISAEEAIKNLIDNTIPNDDKLHFIRFMYGSRYYAIVQKYKSNNYASFLLFGYAIISPIYRMKSNGTWSTTDNTVRALYNQDIQIFVNAENGVLTVKSNGISYDYARK